MVHAFPFSFSRDSEILQTFSDSNSSRMYHDRTVGSYRNEGSLALVLKDSKFLAFSNAFFKF